MNSRDAKAATRLMREAAKQARALRRAAKGCGDDFARRAGFERAAECYEAIATAQRVELGKAFPPEKAGVS
jgi:hypothetical protein